MLAYSRLRLPHKTQALALTQGLHRRCGVLGRKSEDKGPEPSEFKICEREPSVGLVTGAEAFLYVPFYPRLLFLSLPGKKKSKTSSLSSLPASVLSSSSSLFLKRFEVGLQCGPLTGRGPKATPSSGFSPFPPPPSTTDYSRPSAFLLHLRSLLLSVLTSPYSFPCLKPTYWTANLGLRQLFSTSELYSQFNGRFLTYVPRSEKCSPLPPFQSISDPQSFASSHLGLGG